MAQRISADEAVRRGIELMHRGFHCGPAVMTVAQEVFQFEPKATWAAINFMGGVAECQNAPCGGLSGGIAALGMMFGKKGLGGKEAAREARRKSRQSAKRLFRGFESTFGDTECFTLTGYDFSILGKFEEFGQAGEFEKKCDRYVEYVMRTICQIAEEEGLYPEEDSS